MCSRSSFPSVGCEAVGPRTTGASLLMAPTDPGLCEDGSNSLPRDGRKKTFRTRFLSALPLALEGGGSALPLADSDYCDCLPGRPHAVVRSIP